jgi:hypothetical protein
MDSLAFERDDCFEFVKRIDLRKLVEENIQKALIEDGGELIIYCNKEGLKYYRKYNRTGRKDLLVKAPFKDFEHLIYMKFYK